MFFKKKTQTDTNYVKQKIISWAASRDVEIHLLDIVLGDFRDGPLCGRVSVFLFFKTNIELEKYKDDGFISKLKDEFVFLLKDAISKPEEIDFVFDSHENVELNCNGNYLRYGIKNSN